ncbi:hypothetical protein M5K25_017849 [Dendrobium thyrsiflorum]|uniref:DUF4283 domain-containing protein n=1 Tax=Dendrobium thyrsiflorum TaxID=117978 RepID=A0ABD0UGN4_DENTH
MAVPLSGAPSGSGPVICPILADPGFLSSVNKSRSFKDVIAGASASSFPDLRPTTHCGLTSLWVSEEEVLALAAPFQYALVGKFSLRRPKLDLIRNFFFNLKLSAAFSIIKWSPLFDISTETPIVPIWISFPELRPHFFSHRILHGLGCLFGRPLQIDNATAMGSRPSIARDDVTIGGNNSLIGIEADLTKVSKSLSLDVTNMVPVVVIPTIFDTSLNADRDNALQCDSALAPNDDSGSVCPSDKSDDQWEEEEINSDAERDTLLDSHLVCNAKASKDDSEWTYVKGKNRGCAKVEARVRIRNLCRIHSIHLLVIIEPMVNASKISVCMKNFDFQNNYASLSGRIWIFWNNLVNLSIIDDYFQVVHCSFNLFNTQVFSSFVYASCSKSGRTSLWQNLCQWASAISGPWMLGGDFNIITQSEEKMGGAAPNLNAMEDFNDMIRNCCLSDIGFTGSSFTWSNNRVWERLDRVLFNGDWINSFTNSRIQHLSRTASNHCPLLINVSNKALQGIHSFRFQNMWLKDVNFSLLVKENWDEPISYYQAENIVVDLEHQLVHSLNLSILDGDLLSNAKVNLLKLQEMEEIYWRQKSASKFIAEGETNTKFFHNLVKTRRVKSSIKAIKLDSGDWTFDSQVIIDSAVNYFKNSLGYADSNIKNISNPNLIPSIISTVDNSSLSQIPVEAEILSAIMAMNRDSVAGFIPVDVQLQKKDIILTSKCQCCSSVETILHVFLKSPIAVKVWNMVQSGLSLYLDLQASSVCSFLNSLLHLNGVKPWMMVFPLTIFWLLWEARNCCKHAGIKMCAMRIMNSFIYRINQLWKAKVLTHKHFQGRRHWCKFFNIKYELIPILPVTTSVVWRKPLPGEFKLNIHVVIIDQFCGIGGLLRDSDGKFIFGFSCFLRDPDIITGFIYGILFACKDRNCIIGQRLIIEVDNEEVPKIFLYRKNVNLKAFYYYHQLVEIMRHSVFNFNFISSKANGPAVGLAGLGRLFESSKFFDLISMPKRIRGLIYLDAIGFLFGAATLDCY